MISMKFPLFTYICVLGNWFTTKVVTWNDLQCWFCSDHHGVARCWLDITRLLLFIRDSKRPTAQLAKETKGRREGKKERSCLFLTISASRAMFYAFPLLREDWELLMARWEWNSASAEKSAPGHTQNIICLQTLFFLTISFNFCKRFSWL